MLVCRRIIPSVVFFVSVLLLSGCSTKEETKNVSLAGNRTMGVSLRQIQTSGETPATSELSNFFVQLSAQAIKDRYISKIKFLNLQSGNLLESPENLYEIGRNEVDDIFMVDVNLRGPFQIPPLTPNDEEGDEPAALSADQPQAELTFSILNGGNLKTVTIFKVLVPSDPKHFVSAFRKAFNKVSAEFYPNPNLYPLSKPEYFANSLFVYSQQREKEVEESGLTCEAAPRVLQFYPKAEELYKIALSRGSSKVVGQQQEYYQLSSRHEEAQEKAKIIRTCIEDAQLSFRFDIDYGKIDAKSQQYIQDSIARSKLESLLKKYTNRPAKLRFQIEGDGSLSMFVEIRFTPEQYRAWIKGRIPDKYQNFQILSLDPYYSLMQTMVILRDLLSPQAPSQLRQAFQKMKMNVVLKTLLNGEVFFGANGTYTPEKKRIQMAYPNTIYLSGQESDTKVIRTRDNTLFQEKGWIALGNCKTIDGGLTEDGLAYRFFGFPCR